LLGVACYTAKVDVRREPGRVVSKRERWGCGGGGCCSVLSVDFGSIYGCIRVVGCKAVQEGQVLGAGDAYSGRGEAWGCQCFLVQAGV
jgi:hypothetical protein